MDTWTYQGIELHPNETPLALYERLCRLERALGLDVQFEAIGTFRAPVSKSDPPRFSSKGKIHQFLHIMWRRESAQAWSILLHVAELDRRALLSSYTGVGFLSKDIDFRDGHPRESILLAAFTSDAEDFLEPLSVANEGDAEKLRAEWGATIERALAAFTKDEGSKRDLASAARLLEAHRVRFEHGWYLSSGEWRSRYLVQEPGGFMALAAAQESLCTCASRHPEMLQLMMSSNGCVHHLAAKLLDLVAESALQSSGRS